MTAKHDLLRDLALRPPPVPLPAADPDLVARVMSRLPARPHPLPRWPLLILGALVVPCAWLSPPELPVIAGWSPWELLVAGILFAAAGIAVDRTAEGARPCST